MDDIDPDQVEIMGLLAPYLGRMFPLFDAAVDLYNTEYTPLVRAQHNDTATATDVWCHIWHGFQHEFADETGFHFLKVRGLHLLNVGDRLLIRTKKVDENGRHQNADTQQQRAFDAQEELPGLPPKAARLVMGYQPDAAFSRVERVIVRRPLGRWIAQIVEDGSTCKWIDITPVELPFRGGRRGTGG
jgi:hypothetical protein